MPEIIDLLSSSPLKQPQQTIYIQNRSIYEDDDYNVEYGDFDTTGDLECSLEQPSKRRRLTPSPVLPSKHIDVRPLGNDVFELSSEGNDPEGPGAMIRGDSSKKCETMEFDIDEMDIFRFGSSTPRPMQRSMPKQSVVYDLSSDPEPVAPSDPISVSSPLQSPRKLVLLEKTNNLIIGPGNSTYNTQSKPQAKARPKQSATEETTVRSMAKFKQITKSSTVPRIETIDSSQPQASKQRASSTAKSPSKTVAATSKAKKEAEKAAEKERKRKEKEQRAIDKQRATDIAEVNKSKTNKKNSTAEMILDMPASLQGLSVGNQIEEYMKQLDVPVFFSTGEEVDLTSTDAVSSGQIIRWRRKVIAEYDEDLGIRIPISVPRITREKNILIYLKAEEFVRLAVIGNSCSVSSASDVSEATMKTNLDKHVEAVRIRHVNNTILYLIEGLNAWNRKSQTAKNRAYTAAVRSQAQADEQAASSAASQPRRKATSKRKQSASIDLSSITPEVTESLLLHLQLHHQPLLIHHTTSPTTTASQISTFTQHLSTRPYRLAEQSHNLASASFCMTTGQIRTGATPHETYINMLQEVNRVTPSMAYGISSAGYKNVGELVRGFRTQGNLMLEDVRKSVNKDGAWSDRRLGPMVSKRLFKVFMGKDPGARDGIA